MRYITEFRDQTRVRNLLKKIRDRVVPGRQYRLMEFCGGHTHSFFRFGLIDLLPKEIKLLHGPGCPVCVLPISRIDAAIRIAEQEQVILCSYGDMLRVPGSNHDSLLKAKARGADVRNIYSPTEVAATARQNLDKVVVFFAVGFETTTPPTAALLDMVINDASESQQTSNLQVFCNHLLTPPAVKAILDQNNAVREKNASSNRNVQGLIGPGHVSLITGSAAYDELAARYRVPITISGFEPADLLQSILVLVDRINNDQHGVENEYLRAVTPAGNSKAQQLMRKYFTVRPAFEWRGLGIQQDSALKLRDEYHHFDAEVMFSELISESANSTKVYKACECPAVLTGTKSPTECPLFDNPCTPENPLGSCMVSSEGACAAYYHYHRHTSA